MSLFDRLPFVCQRNVEDFSQVNKATLRNGIIIIIIIKQRFMNRMTAYKIAE